jgi:hypothetical protein
MIYIGLSHSCAPEPVMHIRPPKPPATAFRPTPMPSRHLPAPPVGRASSSHRCRASFSHRRPYLLWPLPSVCHRRMARAPPRGHHPPQPPVPLAVGHHRPCLLQPPLHRPRATAARTSSDHSAAPSGRVRGKMLDFVLALVVILQ